MPNTIPSPVIEICVDGLDGLLAAQQGGADRAELCSATIDGGLTPSIGTVKEALRLAKIPFFVIIRPRGGDFLFSDTEFATMLTDVETLRDLGVQGVVIGCLTANGEIDEARTRLLVERARPMRVTCHRAFDMTADPKAALETLIRCGVDRVLTSGQRPSAMEGLALLRALVEQAGDRIIVMGCGQLDTTTIAQVHRETGVKEMHFSANSELQSGMVYRNTEVAMGSTGLAREFINTVTDPAKVRATIAAVRGA